MATNDLKVSELPAATAVTNASVFVVDNGGATLEQAGGELVAAGLLGDLSGAAAELAHALSAGKNLLAQNLRAKGVADAAAGDTLVKLADDVNNLNVDPSAENVTGLLPSYKAWNSYSQAIAADACPAGYTAFVYQNKLYVHRVSALTENLTLENIIGNSLSADLHTPVSGHANISTGTDGGRIAVFTTGNNLAQIYSYDAAAGTLAFEKEFSTEGLTAFPSTSSGKVLISPDAGLLAWTDAGNTVYFYHVDLQKLSTYTGFGYVGILWEGDLTGEMFYAVSKYNYATYLRGKINVAADGTVSLAEPYMVRGTGSYETPLYMRGLFLGLSFPIKQSEMSSTSRNNKTGYFALPVSVVDLANKQQSNLAYINIRPMGLDNLYYSLIALGACRGSKQGDIYTLKWPLMQGALNYNSANNTLTAQGVVYAVLPDYSSRAGENNIFAARVINWGEDGDAVYFTAFGGKNYPTESNGVMYLERLQYKKNQMLHKKRTINGAALNFVPHVITVDDVNANVYALTTAVTPAPAAEAQI